MKVLHFQRDVQDHPMLVHLVLSLAIPAVWAQEQVEGLQGKISIGVIPEKANIL